MTFAPGTKVDYDFHVSTDIAFADFDAVKGQGVGPTLASLLASQRELLPAPRSVSSREPVASRCAAVEERRGELSRMLRPAERGGDSLNVRLC